MVAKRDSGDFISFVNTFVNGQLSIVNDEEKGAKKLILIDQFVIENF